MEPRLFLKDVLFYLGGVTMVLAFLLRGEVRGAGWAVKAASGVMIACICGHGRVGHHHGACVSAAGEVRRYACNARRGGLIGPTRSPPPDVPYAP